MLALRNIWSIYKREIKALFLSPIAYVVVAVFILLSMVGVFGIAGFLERGNASLEPFFVSAYILLSLLGPAVAMRLWSDEQRDGTIELLLTLPTSPWHAILGKFLAACTVWAIALLLTFPLVITVNYLGDPDPGPIWSGYLSAFLYAASVIAITMAVSAFTRNQVVCFIIAVAICLAFTLLGFEFFRPGMRDLFGEFLTRVLSNISPMTHALEMGKGMVRFSELFLFGSICVVGLLITSIAVRAQRA